MTLLHMALAVLIVLMVFVFVGAACGDPLPYLPNDLRIPDMTGAPITPPTLTMTGYPLVMSNSPETIEGVYTSAALYRTAMSRDHFRVFFHHQNMTGKPIKIGIAITNPAAAKCSVDLFTGRNCQMLPGASQSTVSLYPATAGSIALKNWFQSKPDDRYLASIAPGTTHYILQDVPHQSTVTGMYDFGIRAAAGSKDAPNVIVTVLACVAPPDDPTVINVLQPDRSPDGWYRRGTFAHSDRAGKVECDVSQVSWLDIAGPHTGPHARLMGNEMEKAIDDPYGMNPGNYGVVYNLRLAIKNPTPDPVRTRCIISAAGGPSFSNVAVNQVYSDSGKLLGSYGSWVFKDFSLDPTQTADFKLDLSLPGGSNGAHRLYIWPGDDPDRNVVKSIDLQL